MNLYLKIHTFAPCDLILFLHYTAHGFTDRVLCLNMLTNRIQKESMHERWIYISNLWRQSTLTCIKSHCGIEKCLSLSKPMVKALHLSIYQKLVNSKLSMSLEFAARKVWAWFHGYIPQLSTLASKASLICRSTEIIRFIQRVRSRDFDSSGTGQIRHTWPHLQEETLVLLKISTPIVLPDCYWATNCSEHISASRLVQSVRGCVATSCVTTIETTCFTASWDFCGKVCGVFFAKPRNLWKLRKSDMMTAMQFVLWLCNNAFKILFVTKTSNPEVKASNKTGARTRKDFTMAVRIWTTKMSEHGNRKKTTATNPKESQGPQVGRWRKLDLAYISLLLLYLFEFCCFEHLGCARGNMAWVVTKTGPWWPWGCFCFCPRGKAAVVNSMHSNEMLKQDYEVDLM